jgi:glycosyltransferase involved in cell wall biosynthesis
MNMKISVIIPSFNRAHTLPRAIDSVIHQTKPADEIIIVDDGSTDDTQLLIQQRYPMIKYLHQDNQGVSSARNLGIKSACSSSTWIALLDSDDEWHPNKLEHQMQALANKPSPLCHTDEIWIRDGRPVNQMKKHAKSSFNLFERSLNMCLISPSSALIRRDIFDQIGLFDTTLPACEDYDLWLRICISHDTTFVPQPLTIKYGGHNDQLSKKYWGMDRFRITSLIKLLNNHNISQNQTKSVLKTLSQKMSILEKGAIKHNNNELLTLINDQKRTIDQIISTKQPC